MEKNAQALVKIGSIVMPISWRKRFSFITLVLVIAIPCTYSGQAFPQTPVNSPPDDQIENRLLAEAYSRQGQHDKALVLQQKILAAYQTRLGPDHLDTLRSMDNLAATYNALGQYDKVLALNEKTVVAYQAKLGADHANTLASMYNLAVTYGNLGQYDKALTLYEKTLGARQTTLGEDHPETLAHMYNLAVAYTNLKQHAKALMFYEKTLAARQVKLGADHPVTLANMGMLANTYSALGQHEKALALRERTLLAYQSKLGADHPGTLTSMANLAFSYSMLNQHVKARLLWEKTLLSYQAKFGVDHPNTLTNMVNLASTYKAQGQYDEARTIQEKVYAIRLAKLGTQHPSTLDSLNELATTYRNLGQHDKVLSLLEEELLASQNKLGENHQDVLTSMNNVAATYYALGQYDKALLLHGKTLAARQSKLGIDHPDTLASMNELAVTYHALGQYDKAQLLNEKTLAARQKMLGVDHIDTLTSMNNMAYTYGALDQHEKALTLQEKTLTARQSKLGADHPDTLISMSNLATTHLELRQYDKALLLQRKVLVAFQTKLGPDHPDTLISMNNLASTYGELGQHSMALPLKEKTLIGFQIKLGTDHPNTLSGMNNLAITFSDLGQHKEALALIPPWHQGVERLRKLPGLAREQQQGLFATYADSYQRWSREYALQKREVEGFDLGDLSKARTLIDTLKAQSALRSLPAEQQARVLNLQAQSQAQQKILDQLLSAGSVSAERSLAQQKSVDAANAQYLQLQSSLKSQYPKYAQLTDLQPASARLAPQLLGESDVFISYLVRQTGQAQAFVLTKSGKVSWVDLGLLPNLSSSVAASREIISPSSGDEVAQGRLVTLKSGGYAWLQPSDATPVGASAAITSVPAARALLQQYWYDKLIKPILPLAGAYTRWIISPDKDLALLPFDTLPDASLASGASPAVNAASASIAPNASGATTALPPLVQTRSLTLVQSFAVYALLKAREAEYARLPRSKALFAMGNAVYGKGWEQSRGMKRGADLAWRSTNTDLLQSLRSNDARGKPMTQASESALMRTFSWQNLPGTGTEVNAISKVFAQSGVADILLGPQASEAQLLALNASGKLRDYRYLLFSAHGYLAQNPALSALVLSQVGNAPEHDGYITAEEWPLYDLRSDLTVLSACDTGVGKTLAGEGVMGLPYALFVAGNKNTLLSLWPVDDDATAEFMRTFFEKLAQGVPQPQALADTKRAFLRNEKWNDPRYWAAFVLYGV